MLKRWFHGRRLHQFTSLVLYSTSSENGITMADFLVKSVGFSQDEAVSIATNCKSKSTKNSQQVIDFLKRNDFDDTQIRNVVASYPPVLRIKVEKTLEPKIRFLQELGFSGSQLGLIVSQNRFVLYRSLNRLVVPALEMLKSFLGGHEQLVDFMLTTRKLQRLFSGNFLEYFPANLLLLQSYGVRREELKWLMLTKPVILTQRTEWVEKLLKGVEEKLGISRTSAMFLHGVIALSHKSDEDFEKWRQVFRSHGWSETQMLELLRKQPSCLGLSEKEASAKLKYFMEEIGCGCDYLAARPSLLAYSMEKRTVPRTAVIQALKENQLLKQDVSLYTYMCIGELKFMEIYMLPVKDKLPELYEYYIQARAGSLSKT